MPRVKRSVTAKKKRRKILKMAKGFFGARSRLLKTATEAVDRAMKYAYRDRRVKKRDFRSLWIVRISAGAHANGVSYSAFIAGLKKAGVDINRKILADLAATDQQAFSRLVAIAKESAGA